jgi:YHS domain-containing protein
MKRLFITAVIGFCILAVSVEVSSKDLKKNDGPVKPYTLSICLVTESDLGSMGSPITKVYNGQQIKFCCKPCVKEFEKNPAVYLKKLTELSQKADDSTTVPGNTEKKVQE